MQANQFASTSKAMTCLAQFTGALILDIKRQGNPFWGIWLHVRRSRSKGLNPQAHEQLRSLWDSVSQPGTSSRINARGDDAYRGNADGCASTLRADVDGYAVPPADRQQHVHAGGVRHGYACGRGRALHADARDYAARLDAATPPIPSAPRLQ